MWALLIFGPLLLTASGEFLNFTQTAKDTKDIVELLQGLPHHEGPKRNITFLSGTTDAVTGVTISENYTFAHNISEDYKSEEEFYDFKLNYSVPWNIFIALLMQESFDQINNIQHNIKNNYQLTDDENSEVDRVFNRSETEFENLIIKKHKIISAQKNINTSQEFMLDFLDASNSYIKKIVELNLGLIKGKLDGPTTWFEQSLRDKIIRQQSKNSSNYIGYRVCKVLSLCREKTTYSAYVTEWIGHLLCLAKTELKDFFVNIPRVLKAHSEFIRSNLKFRQTLKYIINSHEMVQRDTLDFVDEVLTKRSHIYKQIPEALRHGARALTQLFNLIDNHYELDDENCVELDDISDILSMWRYQDINVFYVIESIIDNMKMNIETWPKDVVSKIQNIWYQITVL